MKVLITGICGFVGSSLAFNLKRQAQDIEVYGIDNLSRAGSEQNRRRLAKHGVRLWHGDIRMPSDLEVLPTVDWVVDSAANPSVLAGVNGETSSRQLVEHNLLGTLNLLEFCRAREAGLILISTSRVYSLAALSGLPLETVDGAFVPRFAEAEQPGLSWKGLTEDFSTKPPVSLYGSAKLASELLILEYGSAFNLPVFINRCGVLAGAGQFGKADQGIFSFWIHSYRSRRPLKYTGFDGTGYQVRDCLHPNDLATLIQLQLHNPQRSGHVVNAGGGPANSISLAQLTRWCKARFGRHEINPDPNPRPFDIPWLVLDSALADQVWGWRPAVRLEQILDEIAAHAEENPNWLELTSGA
jgi:CDP-paratose 2-epimerase